MYGGIVIRIFYAILTMFGAYDLFKYDTSATTPHIETIHTYKRSPHV